MLTYITNNNIVETLHQITDTHLPTTVNKTILHGFNTVALKNKIFCNLSLPNSTFTTTTQYLITHISTLPQHSLPRNILVYFKKEFFSTEITGLYEIVYMYKLLEAVCMCRKINLLWHTDNKLALNLYRRQKYLGRIFNNNTITLSGVIDEYKILNEFITKFSHLVHS
jgi:hypothetical protein